MIYFVFSSTPREKDDFEVFSYWSNTANYALQTPCCPFFNWSCPSQTEHIGTNYPVMGIRKSYLDPESCMLLDNKVHISHNLYYISSI